MDEPVTEQFLRYSKGRLLREQERIHLCFDQLRDDELWRHPGEGSNSIGNIIIHLSGNIGQWMGSIVGTPDIRYRRTEFTDRPELKRPDLLHAIDSAIHSAVRIIDQLDPAYLSRSFSIQDFPVTGLTAIYETIRHLNEHVGQIAFITKLFRGSDFKTLWQPTTETQHAPLL